MSSREVKETLSARLFHGLHWNELSWEQRHAVHDAMAAMSPDELQRTLKHHNSRHRDPYVSGRGDTPTPAGAKPSGAATGEEPRGV